jgi:hypothetical protein
MLLELTYKCTNVFIVIIIIIIILLLLFLLGTLARQSPSNPFPSVQMYVLLMFKRRELFGRWCWFDTQNCTINLEAGYVIKLRKNKMARLQPLEPKIKTYNFTSTKW